MRSKRPGKLGTFRCLACLSVISILLLTTVISSSSSASALVQATNTSPEESHQPSSPAKAAQEQPLQEAPKDAIAQSEPKKAASTITVESSPVEKQNPAAAPPPEVAAVSPAAAAEAKASDRKARADEPAQQAPNQEASKTAEKNQHSDEKKSAEKSGSSEKQATKQEPSASSTSKPKSSSTKTPSSANKSKLSSNLGTVTSTGSGSYLSKHDAYSAIAEKHGSMSAMRKSDKRRAQHHGSGGFGGIQKASGAGLGDMLSPFKGVTDSGLARTLGASMRSIMKSKYSVPAYVASALLGAVALMAFYESPISPLPVPALPEPPVGRFPPGMPNLPVGTQVPFRTNQQQNYNQRSLYAQSSSLIPQFASAGSGQQQQVFFPTSSGSSVDQSAQQRQATGGVSMQQLAANLISSTKQNAQRKSGPDLEPSSRSFFGSNNMMMIGQQASAANQKVASGPANASQKPSAARSILSFFSFGSGSNPSTSSQASSSVAQAAAPGSPLAMPSGDNIHQQQGLSGSGFSMSPSRSSSSGHSSSASALSNSHLVNKVKSLFSRSASSSGSSASSNPYDQYLRMSIVQALMKDTAFLPSFLAPTRKSSPSSGSNGSSSSGSRLQATINSVLGAGASSSQPAVARMSIQPETVQQTSGIGSNPVNMPQQQISASKASSGYGVAKAADRIAHALLETFTYGFLNKNSQSATSSSSSVSDGLPSARKSVDDESNSGPLATATQSLISEFVNMASSSQPAQQPGQHVASSNIAQAAPVMDKPTARSSDGAPQVTGSEEMHKPSEAAASAANKALSSVESAAAVNQQQPVLNRKTRSVESDYYSTQHPSKAAQINNVIDYVADSYANNKLLFNLIMNQVGLSQAVPYVEQILTTGNEPK